MSKMGAQQRYPPYRKSNFITEAKHKDGSTKLRTTNGVLHKINVTHPVTALPNIHENPNVH
jgi:hypothetical protein